MVVPGSFANSTPAAILKGQITLGGTGELVSSRIPPIVNQVQATQPIAPSSGGLSPQLAGQISSTLG